MNPEVKISRKHYLNNDDVDNLLVLAKCELAEFDVELTNWVLLFDRHGLRRLFMFDGSLFVAVKRFL